MPLNYRTALDAGSAFCLHRWRLLPGASECGCYAAMPRSFTFIGLLLVVVALCGCASPHLSQQTDLALYESDQKPLANVVLSIPKGISTNWCQGEWRGELSPAYVRPRNNFLLASDQLKSASWRPMRCCLDLKNAPTIRVMLHPELPNDFVELYIPYGNSSSPPVWNHVTDAGEAERGTLKVLRP